jgi:hypothetical protein
MGKVYAYREFIERYPDGKLGTSFATAIAEFEKWSDELEFGTDPVAAIKYFGRKGDETAVPLLVGKLMVPELREQSRQAITEIGKPSLTIMLEVLLTPFQSLELKDRIAGIVAEMGDVSAIPALRTYVNEHETEAGQKALAMLAGSGSK